MKQGDRILWLRKYKGGFQPSVFLNAIFHEFIGQKAALINTRKGLKVVNLKRLFKEFV